MHKSIKILALALGITAVYADAVMARSVITGGQISNNATISNSDNLATGTAKSGGFGVNVAGGASEANQGTVKVKNSTLRNARITNRATIRNSDNTARDGGRADQGSVIVE